jgi:hypothetical protein
MALKIGRSVSEKDGLPPLLSMTRSYDALCNRRPNRSRPGHHPRIALAEGLVAAQDQQMMTASDRVNRIVFDQRHSAG